MNYEELVKALRCCAENFGCPIECPRYSPADEGVRACVSRLEKDAADAIERLIAERDEAKTDLAAVGRAFIREIEQHEPKQGEWITHPEVKNIYGGVYIECPFCGEKYVVQYIADEKFCRNCGADMRAKMEVQE